MTKDKLDYMFEPGSVAVIGASRSPAKWGASILQHIIEGGYEGEIYPVNPKEEEIQGLKTYPSILETPEVPDLAIIATPNETVPPIIGECVDRGVETAVIISSGFGEASKDRKKVEEEMAMMARRGGLRFAGPNCMGIFSAKSNLHALMPPTKPLRGNVSFISQSGNLGVQMLDRGTQVRIGFDVFVSSGNEADLGCEDYLDYFRKRSSTRVALAYLEGVKDGRKFLKVAKRTVPEKPIIVFKSGETEAGKNAAMSHTGTMAGSKKIHDGIFKQTGIAKAGTTEDILNLAMALSQPVPEDNKLAIVTRGGGWGVVAADACQKFGIEVPQPPPDMMEDLDEILPPYWSKGNPIDSVATVDPSVHLKILDLVEEWNVGGVLILGGIGRHFIDGATDKGISEKVAREARVRYVERIIELSKRKTVFAVGFEVLDKTKPVELLRKNNVPVYHDPDTAVKSYSELIKYKNFLDLER